MNEIKRLIFKVDRLKKNYGSLEAINVKKLEIHRVLFMLWWAPW